MPPDDRHRPNHDRPPKDPAACGTDKDTASHAADPTTVSHASVDSDVSKPPASKPHHNDQTVLLMSFDDHDRLVELAWTITDIADQLNDTKLNNAARQLRNLMRSCSDPI